MKKYFKESLKRAKPISNYVIRLLRRYNDRGTIYGPYQEGDRLICFFELCFVQDQSFMLIRSLVERDLDSVENDYEYLWTHNNDVVMIKKENIKGHEDFVKELGEEFIKKQEGE